MKIYTPTEWKAKEAARGGAEHRTTCTKYELVNVLSAHFPELLEDLRQAYAANTDLQFYWNTVNDLDRTNEDFKRFTAALGITDAQVDAVFNAIGN